MGISALLTQCRCSYQILTQLCAESFSVKTKKEKKKRNEVCKSFRPKGKCRIDLLLGYNDIENMSLSWHKSTYPNAPCSLDAATVIISADQDDI